MQAEDDDGNSAQKQVVTDRKPSLTDSQFESAKKGTKEQIKNVLNNFRMSGEQRTELTKLIS